MNDLSLIEKIKRGERLNSKDLNSIDGICFDGLETLTEKDKWLTIGDDNKFSK